MKEENKFDKLPFVVCLVLFAIVILAYLINFATGTNISPANDDWGTFGDFVGGITNPIIALAVLWYVWKSFQTNRKAIDELVKQTSIQKTESQINSLHSNNSYLLASQTKHEKQLSDILDVINTKKQEIIKAVENNNREKFEKLNKEKIKFEEEFALSKERYLKISENLDANLNKINKLEKALNEIT
ncbi:hypothetical protein [Pseudemcibacter aquimaris]|uniref:hypothetical protein n=1 Tax=Pseudemcibacter aquimaris TaxID=2857064 RepID=UPI002012B903|nr:hypothetical protein [Pseudemcibacter aquimaris]MCC3859862.1 hypothetical protein [Pseudemcibacter aquimaris]WDU57194.1 hypothetical protein KW060_08285 [Pseudemcibacter aquimaris]